MNAVFLGNEQVILPESQSRLEKLNNGDEGLVLLVQDLEQEFDEELNV